jgi:hypothetical protein
MNANRASELPGAVRNFSVINLILSEANSPAALFQTGGMAQGRGARALREFSKDFPRARSIEKAS